MDVRETSDARKNKMGASDALELAKRANTIIVSKGKKTVQLDMKSDKPSAAELKAALLGPTGNLRAPTVLCGKTLLVGFSDSEYARVLT